eukprot:354237-Chlamydomonas_euryale.AAC.1
MASRSAASALNRSLAMAQSEFASSRPPIPGSRCCTSATKCSMASPERSDGASSLDSLTA